MSNRDSRTSPQDRSSEQRRSFSGEPRKRSRSPKNDQALLDLSQPQSEASEAGYASLARIQATGDRLLPSSLSSRQWTSESSPTVGIAKNRTRTELGGHKFTNRLSENRGLPACNERCGSEKGKLNDYPSCFDDLIHHSAGLPAIKPHDVVVPGVESKQDHLTLSLLAVPVSNSSADADGTVASGLSGGFLPLRHPAETPLQNSAKMPRSDGGLRSASATSSVHSHSTYSHKHGSGIFNNALSNSDNHSSLGNRISTFFGQHRSSPNGSRPSTSQGLLEPFSAGKPKDSLSAKRNLFGMPARISRHGSPSSTNGATKESRSQPTPRSRDERIERPNSSVQGVTHLPRNGSPLTSDDRATLVTSTRASPASRNYTLSFDENGGGSTTHNGAGGHSSELQTLTAASSSSAMQPELHSHLADTGISIPVHDQKPLGISGSAWDHWGTLSATSVYPESRTDREKQFSLAINPSLSDGRELMGFGGDLGKKRLYIRDQRKKMTSSTTWGLPLSNGTGTNSEVPYIIGFEKQVLAL